MDQQTWLDRFLNVYWLRPENALWRATTCGVLTDIDYEKPSLDLSCGDGVYSFIQAGGVFSTEFDIFGAVDNLEQFFENADIYNATSEQYDPQIVKRPAHTISVGTDWKPALLDKAAELDFYDELVEHDNNDPLPFEDDHFRTVFSNSVYWVENIDLHLREIKRVTHPEGKAILVLKTDDVTNFLETLWEYESILGSDLIETLDRGRSKNKKHLHDDSGWTQRLHDAGLEVIERRPTVTQFHGQMWDIGLRPISPHLIEMAYSLPPERRRAIKEDWLNTWERLLKPFSEPDFDIKDRPPVEIAYVVRPE